RGTRLGAGRETANVYHRAQSVQGGFTDAKKREGARAACSKPTPSMDEVFVEYLGDNCQYTLAKVRNKF
ncbi:hypothetical protein L917_04082, partial [Phytophthora nicotianae]